MTQPQIQPRPIIGITPDRNDTADNIEAHFFARRNYCAAIAAAGGVPLLLPYQDELVPAYLDLVDGLLLTGGMFDIDPALYGAAPPSGQQLVLQRDRTRFEQTLLRGALERDMPLLGICGGMQLIAVELGARLYQHLPSDLASDIEHKQSAPCDTGSHAVTLVEGSALRAIAGVAHGRINSLHHQAVIAGNARLRVAALAGDGVIEAIEAPEHAFCVGVQWHPEYAVNSWEHNLFAALVAAARKHAHIKGETA